MTASVKRKAPRKAANGSAVTNGTPRAALREPEEFVSTPKAEGEQAPAVESPYGDKQTYTFSPIGSEIPIVFPHISTVEADAHFFWKIYQMNEMFQAFEWMNKAGVPMFIQERVMLLPDAEKQRFFAGWFSAVVTPQGVAPPGES